MTQTNEPTAVHASIARADALVLEDYNKGVLVPRVIEAAMRAAQARGPGLA